MFDWMIIGGGIQGVTLATFLLKTGKTTVDQLAIVDMNDEPLARWKRLKSHFHALFTISIRSSSGC